MSNTEDSKIINRTQIKSDPKKDNSNQSLPDEITNTHAIEVQNVQFLHNKIIRKDFNHKENREINIELDNPTFPFLTNFHNHDYFELVYCVNDKFEMQIESELCMMQQGDVCILNPAIRHFETYQADTAVIFMVLSRDYLESWPRDLGVRIQKFPALSRFFNSGLHINIGQDKNFIYFQQLKPPSPTNVASIIEQMQSQFENRLPGYQLFIRGLLFQLFATIANPDYYQTKYFDAGTNDGYSLALSAKKILDKNKKRITKDDLAKQLNYNGEYISRVFKKHYQLSITEYNKMICLKEATTLLVGTNLHIHLILKQLGFTNRTHFYKLFEAQYGCTPAEYRNKEK